MERRGLLRISSGRWQREFNVPLEAIEKYIGCKSKAFSMNDCIRLRKVFTSLKDGMSKREDYFDLGVDPDPEIKNPYEEKAAGKGKHRAKRPDAEPNVLCARRGNPAGRAV